MTRPLSNKALMVLSTLRGQGEMTCKEIAQEIMASTPCGHCGGTGDGDDSLFGCRRCYGRGQKHFSYSDAYVALTQLRSRHLVSRRHLADEWGDELPGFVWAATALIDSPDPLEILYQAASAERTT